MRLETDENFDPRTLYVPPDFLKQCTNAMRQWWTFKTKYFDSLLFFKVMKILLKCGTYFGRDELVSS